MNRITRIALVLAITVFIVGLSACDELASILPVDESSDYPSRELPIGIVLPMSGEYVDGPNDPVMRAMLNGFDLALNEINTTQIGPARFRFIIEDDRSTEAGAVQAFNKLIHQDGVIAIIGPSGSDQAREVFPISDENRIVAISPTSAASGVSAISDFTFRVSLTVGKLVPLGVGLTHKKLGYARVAKIVDHTDLFSQSSDTAIAESLGERGVEIVTTETFKTKDADLSAQLTRIEALNPDAIFVSAQPIDQPKVLTQGREVGIPGHVPFIVPLLSISEVEKAGNAAEGTITFANWTRTADRPRNQSFVQNYMANYGIAPNTFAAECYTAVYILAQSIKRAQSTDSVAIRDEMALIRDLDTVLGKFSFDAVGDSVYDPIILVVENSRLEIFD